MPRLFIGVDPGASGYICILDPRAKRAHFIRNDNEKISDIFAELTEIMAWNLVPNVMIEDVHSLFGMSAKSNFQFGRNLGIIQTILKLTGCPMESVQPKHWQKTVGIEPIPPKTPTKLRTKLQKQAVEKVCRELYPNIDIYGPKGGLLDGKSDALMIAHYSYLQTK